MDIRDLCKYCLYNRAKYCCTQCMMNKKTHNNLCITVISNHNICKNCDREATICCAKCCPVIGYYNKECICK